MDVNDDLDGRSSMNIEETRGVNRTERSRAIPQENYFRDFLRIREIYLPKRVLAIEYRFPGIQDPARSEP